MKSARVNDSAVSVFALARDSAWHWQDAVTVALLHAL